MKNSCFFKGRESYNFNFLIKFLIIKSIIRRALDFDVHCNYIYFHESCNLESNKIIFKSIINLKTVYRSWERLFFNYSKEIDPLRCFYCFLWRQKKKNCTQKFLLHHLIEISKIRSFLAVLLSIWHFCAICILYNHFMKGGAGCLKQDRLNVMQSAPRRCQAVA